MMMLGLLLADDMAALEIGLGSDHVTGPTQGGHKSAGNFGLTRIWASRVFQKLMFRHSTSLRNQAFLPLSHSAGDPLRL